MAMEVVLFNRQRTVALPTERLRALAAAAATQCLRYPGASPSVLAGLSTVEISLVSDRVIARVHRQFMQVPGTTDVITFPHGEIIIGAATADRQARQNGETTGREVARYIVHGFLHLHGHEDAEKQAAATMWKMQERLLEELWPTS